MNLTRIFIASTVVGLLACACDSRKTGTSDNVDSVTVSTPDISVADFTSNDLTFFEVHGHVKTIHDQYSTIVFNEQGELISVDGQNPFEEREITGDDYLKYTKKSGFIVIEDRYESQMQYIWNNGRPDSCEWVSESWIGHESYKYDDKGLLTEMITNQQDFGELPETFTAKYVYDEFDDHRNWLQRTIYANDTVVEKRTIDYYK